MLRKDQVCVYIENEAQLQEAKELLEKYGCIICDDATSKITPTLKHLNHLQVYVNGEWWLGSDTSINITYVKITLQELEIILKAEL